MLHPLDAARELYPTLGLHSPDETVVINLGGSAFRFDVQAMIDEERQKKLAQVSRHAPCWCPKLVGEQLRSATACCGCSMHAPTRCNAALAALVAAASSLT